MRTLRRTGLLLALLLLVLFGALAAYTLVQTRRAESLHPPAGEFVTVEGVKLHYVRKGAGQSVVLLHGNPGFVQDWSLATLELLAQRYHVAAFDRPGHGYSERASAQGITPSVQVQMLHQALEELRIIRPVLVGHSWGGALALIYALTYPENVAGLVLMGTRAFPVEGGTDPVYTLMRTPVVGEVFRNTLLLPVGRGMVERGLARVYMPDAINPAHERAARALWLRPRQAAAAVWDTQNLNEELRAVSRRYGEITHPVIIIVGDHDQLERESVPLSRVIRGAELLVLLRTGHQIPQTRPQVVLDAVSRIVERASSQTEP